MKKRGHFRGTVISLYRYMVFFLLVAFVITCCMELFITVMVDTMDIEPTARDISAAAKLTFVNVILLSALLTAADGVRRKWTIDRPVRRIRDGAKKIMAGDFSGRIEPLQGIAGHQDGFNEIIDCFNQMARELEGMESLQADFLANVSHELKTPLAVMGNYGTLLRQPGLSEEKRMEYAGAVADASHRMAELITNILKLNKLENQQIFPRTEDFDLTEQLCRCLLGFESIWEQKEIQIETELEEGVFVRGDSELMSIVWNNLLSNAFKFTAKDGTVTVRLWTEGNCAVVQVRDTGCGITREVGARIFEKFYQGDTSHSNRGNGLGLALVRRVVDITRGEISVESEAGRGSAFTVRIRRDGSGTA